MLYVPSPLICEASFVDNSVQTPFWANNHLDMYSRVLHDKLQFPEDRTMDQDTKSLIRSVSVMRWFSLCQDH